MAITPFTLEEKVNWHSTLPKKACAAAIICVNPERKMLAVKASYKNYWSLPGGVVDEDESPLPAALRELNEEASILLEAAHIAFAGVAYHGPNNGIKDFFHFLFLAEDVEATPTPDGHEILEAKWVTPAEFRQICGGKAHLLYAADIVEKHTPPLFLEDLAEAT